MADSELTQSEADALLAAPKVKMDDRVWEYPGGGEAISVPLASKDKREFFQLDISRRRLEFRKGTYQNRARQVIILARLDFGGPPHRNPDDQDVPCPHLHLYRQGYGDKWAFSVPTDKFPRLHDLWATLSDFMAFCNVVDPPTITRGLFV